MSPFNHFSKEKLPDVLFEDNHLLVLSKPAGMPTQKSIASANLDLEEWGKRWLKEKHQKPGNVFLHAIHRLDKVVSGIVILAKTSKALSRLNQAMRDKQAQKTYLAAVSPPILVEELGAQTFTLEHDLIHGDHRAIVVAEGQKGRKSREKDLPPAKKARLSYQVIAQMKNASLLSISLETGRYHQIRAQFAAIGHPIIGDHLYRSPLSFSSGIALHHYQFSIPHPTQLHQLHFQAPLPKSFKSLSLEAFSASFSLAADRA